MTVLPDRTAEEIDQETDNLASELEEALSYVGVVVTLEDCLTVAADLVCAGWRRVTGEPEPGSALGAHLDLH